MVPVTRWSHPNGTFSGRERIEVVTRIRTNLWQVGGRGLTDPSDAAVYLVQFDEKAALVDAGTGRDHEQLTRNIAQSLGTGVRLEYLLLTHCHFDHAGGARLLRDQFGCRIVAHELDAGFLESGDNRVTGASQYGARLEPCAVDIRLHGQESTIDLGAGTIRALHSPGHSPGSVVYVTEIDGELVLFGQDLQGPLHSDFLSDEQRYLDSLARLLNLQADVLLEGHFGVIEPREEVQDFIQSCITPRPQPCRC